MAALRAVTPFAEVVLSGRLLEIGAGVDRISEGGSACAGRGTDCCRSLPGAWVKHAAQGAAVIADGLAGGRWVHLVREMELRGACGTALDYLAHRRGT